MYMAAAATPCMERPLMSLLFMTFLYMTEAVSRTFFGRFSLLTILRSSDSA